MSDERKAKKARPPATTPEGRENQLIAAAVDLAEKQILDGTASAQVISHFLKLGSPREVLERERLANENALLKAKVETLQQQGRMEELYTNAINAMRTYSGQQPVGAEDGYED